MKDEMKEYNHAPGATGALLSGGGYHGRNWCRQAFAMLVLASVTSLSVGTMFVAGLLPALVLAVCLMVLVYIRAKSVRTIKTTPKQILSTGITAIPALLAPVILVGGHRHRHCYSN